MRYPEDLVKTLEKAVFERGSKTFPGYLALLRTLCMKRFNMSCVELFLVDPEALFQLVISCTGNTVTAKLIVKSLFLKPILATIGLSNNVESFIDMLMRDPREFKEKLLYVVSATNII